MKVRRSVTIVNRAGLHARPCHAIASAALGFQSELAVSCGERAVNGKSVLELMTLAACQGDELHLEARGDDAEALVERLSRLVASGFAEPE